MAGINIPKISSGDFHANNKVYLEVPIITKQESDYHPSIQDGLDLNHNGVVDSSLEYGSSFWNPNGWSVHDKEPSLATPYEKIKQFAHANDTEVVTQESMNRILLVGDYVAKGDRLYTITCKYETLRNKRDLSEVAREEAPLAENPQWAIDTAKKTFIVFEPK